MRLALVLIAEIEDLATSRRSDAEVAEIAVHFLRSRVDCWTANALLWGHDVSFQAVAIDAYPEDEAVAPLPRKPRKARCEAVGASEPVTGDPYSETSPMREKKPKKKATPAKTGVDLFGRKI